MFLPLIAVVACGESHSVGDGAVDRDAGPTPLMDGRVAEVDGGEVGDDATVTRPDAGPIPGEDAGRLAEDGGSVELDGSVEPDAGAPEPCDSPGALETVACGMCGTRDRFCTSDGTWAAGPCEGEGGACMPGALRSAACGACGTREERCTTSCAWVAGACSGEGECTAGERERTGDGCGAGETRELVCNDACTFEEAEPCSADGCPVPGTIETLECGMCGAQDRFCTAEGAWTYGSCEGEGVCVPGTSSTRPCGDCGTQTVRCDTGCAWVPSGACSGEGECAPGSESTSTAGCPAGESRLLACDAMCTYRETEACMVRGGDVIVLFDMTGSQASHIDSRRGVVMNELITPLLADAGTEVGLALYQDFPVSPYGSAGDDPFVAVQVLTRSSSALSAALAAMSGGGGGDVPESTVEALHVLSGGAPPASAVPFACPAGRDAGGCWRPGGVRAIVYLTDATAHNGPQLDGSPGLYSPYSGFAAAEWPTVVARFMADGTGLFAVIRSSFSTNAARQATQMNADLGQDPMNVVTYDTDLAVALRAVVPRIRRHLGTAP